MALCRWVTVTRARCFPCCTILIRKSHKPNEDNKQTNIFGLHTGHSLCKEASPPWREGGDALPAWQPPRETVVLVSPHRWGEAGCVFIRAALAGGTLALALGCGQASLMTFNYAVAMLRQPRELCSLLQTSLCPVPNTRCSRDSPPAIKYPE